VPRRIRVVIGESAQRDAAIIREIIARDKRKAASKWLRDFRAQAKSLRIMPERYEIIPEAPDLPEKFRHLRHIIFGNYRIIFEIGPKSVNIVRVVSAARLLVRGLMELPPPFTR